VLPPKGPPSADAFVAPAGATVEAIIGRGSVFEVAVVVYGGRRLVAKRPRPELRGDAAAARAVEREAAVLSLLDDRRVPAVVASGADQTGPFVLETLVEGPSFRSLSESGASLPWSARASLALRAVVLFRELHALSDAGGPLGFSHGDPSPDHLVLASVDDLEVVEVGLLDFGSASARGVPPVEAGARGTLPYVAPELCRGEVTPSAATDRYALAVVLGQFLSGARLCKATEAAAMLLEIGDRGHDVAALASLPAPVQNALARLLAFQSTDRPGDLDELARALEASAAVE
jgi:serine/threonine protein kinase